MFVRICAAVVAVAALTSACAATEPAPPSPTTTTSSKAPPSVAELDRRAKAALPPPGAFDALGGKVDEASAALDDIPIALEGQAIGEVCGTLLRVDKGTSAARTRSWGGEVNLFERVHATSELPASAVLSTVRQQIRGCVPNRPAGTVVLDVPLAKPEGVEESYAYCEANDPGALPWSCGAALARGNMFALVVVNGQTREAASAQLNDVTPIFAKSLVKV